jgi:hypothetical protein
LIPRGNAPVGPAHLGGDYNGSDSEETAMRCQRARGLSLRIVSVAVVAVIGAALAYVTVRIHGLAGPLAGAYISRGLLYNIYQGLWRYDEATGHLPPPTATDPESGNPFSWRIEVYQSLVRLGHINAPATNGNISVEYDRHKAWNDRKNLRLEGIGFWLFAPHTRHQKTSARGIYATYYKAITGKGTAFDAGNPLSLKQLPKDLILILQVERSDTHWMEPGDLNIDQLVPSDETKRLLLSNDGYVVLFADGERWVLSAETPIRDLCTFFTLAGAMRFDREKILGPYRVLP